MKGKRMVRAWMCPSEICSQSDLICYTDRGRPKITNETRAKLLYLMQPCRKARWGVIKRPSPLTW